MPGKYSEFPSFNVIPKKPRWLLDGIFLGSQIPFHQIWDFSFEIFGDSKRFWNFQVNFQVVFFIFTFWIFDSLSFSGFPGNSAISNPVAHGIFKDFFLDILKKSHIIGIFVWDGKFHKKPPVIQQFFLGIAESKKFYEFFRKTTGFDGINDVLNQCIAMERSSR